LALTITEERTWRKYIPIKLGIETSAPLIMAWTHRLPKFHNNPRQTSAARAAKTSRTIIKAPWVLIGAARWARRIIKWFSMLDSVIIAVKNQARFVEDSPNPVWWRCLTLYLA
jgi:hypothetical protein